MPLNWWISPPQGAAQAAAEAAAAPTPKKRKGKFKKSHLKMLKKENSAQGGGGGGLAGGIGATTGGIISAPSGRSFLTFLISRQTRFIILGKMNHEATHSFLSRVCKQQKGFGYTWMFVFRVQPTICQYGLRFQCAFSRFVFIKLAPGSYSATHLQGTF